jgi:hypothetical protein
MLEGFKASAEVQKERMSICEKCEHNIMNVCKKCGCILVLKTQWKKTKCPINKWDSVRD